jgi:hypothetical protein
MAQSAVLGAARVNDIRVDEAHSIGKSAASWPAIFAGAFVAISVSLVLIALGSGLGFAAVSPWPGRGVSATTFTVTTAIWLIVTQWLSALLGGYIAGRLRTKWVGTHTHEVFFRDTAHGFVMWSVSTVFVAAVLAGSVSSLVGGGLRAIGGAAATGAQMMGPAAGGESSEGLPAGPSAALTYDVDKLFRPAGAAAGSVGAAGAGVAGAASPGMSIPSGAGTPGAAMNPAATSPGTGNIDTDSDPRVEAVYIAFNAMTTGSVPDADRSYLANRVAAQTGVTPAEAQRRVDSFVSDTLAAETKAKAAADKARKAAAEASIYLALSMLVGAFIASVSAAIGGRLRDEHP